LREWWLSGHRPNPIGPHQVRIVGIDGHVLTVHGLEAIDGTPTLGVKPVLGATAQR
jgi:tRNA (Thr-GGU) A37 N-methylase